MDQGDAPTTDDAVFETDLDGFVYLKLDGPRFEGHTLPVDSLGELRRFSALVHEVARQIWLDEHAGRRRVTGALAGLGELHLKSIEPGSARPTLVLHRPRAADTEDEQAALDVMMHARTVVLDSIRSVADGDGIPGFFPRTPDSLRGLRKMGSSLAENEAFVVGQPRRTGAPSDTPADAVVVNHQVRETLKTIDDALTSDPAPHKIEGVVLMLDGAAKTFRIRDGEGVQHHCRLAYSEPRVAAAVKDALAADGVTAPDVRVHGMGILKSDGRLADLWDVERVEVLRTAAEKALMTKLDGLAALVAGWLGPGTVAPSDDALRDARGLVEGLARVGVHIALTANGDGAVVFEWCRGDVECTAEIQPGHHMFLCSDNVVTDALDELDEQFDAAAVIRFAQTGVLR